MAVEYKKLWIKMIEQDITKPALRELADLSPATLTKLNKNEHVSMVIVEKICHALNCDVGDIMEITPSKQKKATRSPKNIGGQAE